MRILCICNGDWIVQESSSDMRRYVELIRNIKLAKEMA